MTSKYVRYGFIHVILLISLPAKAEKSELPGDICHVEVEDEAFYPGLWEPYGKNELICNYWQFLDIDDEEIQFDEGNEENEWIPNDNNDFRDIYN